MSTDPTRDKWDRRRAARRSQVIEEPELYVYRPRCVDWSFRLWIVIGVPTALFVWGIAVIFAARAMRDGYSRARTWLTVYMAIFCLLPLLLVILALPGMGSAWPVALLALVGSALPITATVLMWRPEAGEFFRTAVRRQPR